VAMCTTLISNLKVSLPKFVTVCKDDNEDDVQFLVSVCSVFGEG
jgi:hypothetical protein